ncbi:MAG: alpha-isopropylmalate synthase regulatory domain-containing protein, partial [Actinomycetaceae bacterium]
KVAEAGGDDAAVVWDLPYLPIDPKDVGRSYEAVVRVNSQSGKGGIAYLLHSTRSLDLPRRLQIELAGIVQKHTDAYGGEIDAERLWSIFVDEYLPYTVADGLAPWGRYTLRSASLTSHGEGGDADLTVVLDDGGEELLLSGRGNGPIDAFVRALATTGVEVEVLDYAEHALSAGGDAMAAAYLEVETTGQVVWGVGVDPSTMTASFQAIISAVNRAAREA